jgi:hypothetical protein
MRLAARALRLYGTTLLVVGALFWLAAARQYVDGPEGVSSSTFLSALCLCILPGTPIVYFGRQMDRPTIWPFLGAAVSLLLDFSLTFTDMLMNAARDGRPGTSVLGCAEFLKLPAIIPLALLCYAFPDVRAMYRADRRARAAQQSGLTPPGEPKGQLKARRADLRFARYTTELMHKAARVARLYGITVMLVGATICIQALIITWAVAPENYPALILPTVMFIVPGLLMYLLGRYLHRPAFWPYALAAILASIEFIQAFSGCALSRLVRVPAGQLLAILGCCSFAKLPALYVGICIFQALPDVRSARRAYAVDHAPRGFEPITEPLPPAPTILPPPPPRRSPRAK